MDGAPYIDGEVHGPSEVTSHSTPPPGPYTGSEICLPSEILAMVFIEFVNEKSTQYRDGNLPPSLSFTSLAPSSPVSLAQVCKRWQTIARSIPQLWTNITLILPYNGDLRHTSVSSTLHIARECLDRSGVLPLKLDITATTPSWRTPERFDPTRALITMLCKHSSRWRDVTLVLRQFDVFPALDEGCFTALESLTVHTMSTTPNQILPRSPQFMRALETAPKLRKVFIEDGELLAWPLPWAQLTALRLDNFNLGRSDTHRLSSKTAIFDVLRRCGSLKDLELRLICNKAHIDLSQAHVVPVHVDLHCLQTLRILVETHTVCENLLRFIRAPYLRLLHIRFRHDRHELSQNWDIFKNTVKGRVATLDTLSLASMSLSQSHPWFYEDLLITNISPILLPATNLRVLECHTSDIIPEFLSSLILRFTPTGQLASGQNARIVEIRLLPAFGAKPLFNYPMEEVNALLELLLDVVESRWWLPEGMPVGDDNVQKLRVFDIGPWGHEIEMGNERVEEQIRERYMALKEDGFMFSVKDRVLELVRSFLVFIWDTHTDVSTLGSSRTSVLSERLRD